MGHHGCVGADREIQAGQQSQLMMSAFLATELIGWVGGQEDEGTLSVLMPLTTGGQTIVGDKQGRLDHTGSSPWRQADKDGQLPWEIRTLVTKQKLQVGPRSPEGRLAPIQW